MCRSTRVALCLILVLPCARLAADTITSQNLQWTLSASVNTVEATDKSIPITQKVGKDTKDYALLTCPVDLGSYADWTFSCDFRLGKRESAGSYITLNAGNNSVLLAGGDMWGKQGPLVVLGGRQVLSLTRDNEWHHIDVRYARGAATATVPINKETLTVGSRNTAYHGS